MTPKPTVLVVDDTPANLGLVLESLGSAGLRVLVAESGARALELLAQQPVDLILLDMIMPGLDGLAVCERIRQNQAWRDVRPCPRKSSVGTPRALPTFVAKYAWSTQIPPAARMSGSVYVSPRQLSSLRCTRSPS